jgi:hypothetical protein
LNMVGSDLPVSLSPALARLGSASSMASAALPVLCRATSLVTTLAAHCSAAGRWAGARWGTTRTTASRS